MTRADTSTAVWLRLLQYSRRLWPILMLAAVGMLLDAAAQSGFIYLLRPLIDESFGQASTDFSRWLPAILLGLVAMRIAGHFGGVYGVEWVGQRVVARMRCDLFDKYLMMPARFFDQSSTGQLVSRATYNTDQVAHAATTGLITAVRDSLTAAGLVAVMLIQSVVLTAALLVLLPALAIIVHFIGRRFRVLGHRIQDAMGTVTHVTEEAVRGQQVVKVFDAAEQESRRFSAAADNNRRLQLRLVATRLASSSLVQLFAGLALLLILLLATRTAAAGDITAGTFMSVVGAMTAIMPPLKRLTNVHAQVQRGVAAAESIFAILDAEAEPDRGNYSVERARGRVAFERVSFSYGGDRSAALHNVELVLEPDTVTAVVGPSGSGKSTLAALIPRFYEPDCGLITVDGVALQDWSLSSLRRQIAYVGQDVVLFNDTLAGNIAYGALAGANRQQVEAAARAAHVLEFADNLPRGLDTPVGDRGDQLSGGQRQRVAMARALLKNAPILILDEATSALDSSSERSIQATLQTMIESRTTLVIAHRISTVEAADRIVVLKDGAIVEQGRHPELLDQDGLYASLYRLQFAADA